MVLWQWSNPLAQFQLDEALPFLDCQGMEESLIRSHVKWCWMVDSVQQTCGKSVIVVRNRCLETKVVRSLPHFHPAKEVDSPSPVILLIQKQYALVISICIISFDSLKNNGSSRCYRNILFPMLTMMVFLNATQVREEIRTFRIKELELETLFFTLLRNHEAENEILLHHLEGFQHPICLPSFRG